MCRQGLGNRVSTGLLWQVIVWGVVNQLKVGIGRSKDGPTLRSEFVAVGLAEVAGGGPGVTRRPHEFNTLRLADQAGAE